MSDLPLAVVGLNLDRSICDQLAARPGGVRLAAVCDPDEALARRVGERHGVPAFTSIEPLLVRADLPAVALFTAPDERASLIRRLFAAGKDVMAAAPLERGSAAAAAVLAEARRLRRVLWLDSPSQSLPADLALMRRLAETHDLGPVVGARAEVWADRREQADGGWRDDPARCPVAPVYRLGLGLIHDLVRLLGPVAQVHAQTSHLRTGRPTPDQGLVSLRFRNGALASVFASFCVGDGDQERHGLVLNHLRGTIYRDTGPHRSVGEHAGDGCQVSLVVHGQQGREVRAERWVRGISGECDWAGFAAAVQARTVPDPATVAAAVDGLRVVEAMAASEESGLPVDVAG